MTDVSCGGVRVRTSKHWLLVVGVHLRERTGCSYMQHTISLNLLNGTEVIVAREGANCASGPPTPTLTFRQLHESIIEAIDGAAAQGSLADLRLIAVEGTSKNLSLSL